jgi:hypothetical protein
MSTYSTNLKIELIGDGEQSGTWGSTTNGNLGTVLEQAIVGKATVNFPTDASITITMGNGPATSDTRCLLLSLTSSGSLTATRTLTVPSIQKTYMVYNGTTGSQSITVSSGAGTTVTIPNGKRVLVYVDTTTGVYQQFSDLVSGTTLNNLALATTTDIVGKNRIINGAFWTGQRANLGMTAGTAVPTASTGYPFLDRWFVYSTGGNPTVSQVGVIAGGTPRLGYQVAGAASVTAVGIGQRIELLNCYDMANQTCTLSAWMSNSLLTTVTWTASSATTNNTFGTIGTPTKTTIATGTFAVTATMTKFTASFTMPAVPTGVEILFTVGAQTSGTWILSQVQFETGPVATPFEFQNYSTQLAQCQRYFTQLPNQIVNGYNTSGNLIYNQVTLPVFMFAASTVVFTLAGNGNASTAVLNAISTQSYQARTTITTTGHGYSVCDMTFSAEIP